MRRFSTHYWKETYKTNKSIFVVVVEKVHKANGDLIFENDKLNYGRYRAVLSSEIKTSRPDALFHL